MNKIAIDIVGPLRRTEKNNAYILTVYDTFSHWPSAYPIESTEGKTVINCLKKHIALYSVPAKIISDRGRNFMSKEVSEFIDKLGAEKVATAAYKPSSNGSVERFHAYLAQSISHVVKHTHEDWDEHIDSMLFAYRVTPLDGINVSPYEIMYGREPNLPIDNLLGQKTSARPITTPEEHIEAVVAQRAHLFPAIHKQRLQRFLRNQRADGPVRKLPHYPIGTRVYLSFPKGRFRPIGGTTKFSDVNGGPYEVLEIKMDGLVYSVQHVETGFISNVSVTRMIPMTDAFRVENPRTSQSLGNSSSKSGKIDGMTNPSDALRTLKML
jgi:transposase InsO family protein